jgi:hypothetical protein
MSDFSLPDPAKYNSLQSEALFRDAFATLSEPQIQFAKDVAALAEKRGIDAFTLKLEPKFSYECNISGDVTVAYSAKDGRGRPCRNLIVSCNATLRHVIEENEESSN